MPRKTGLLTLKKRPAFLAIAATRKKWVAPGLILQIGPATTSPAQTLRPCFGLTASKKVGGAVERNRARRRLRALAQEILALHAKKEHDYVLIARPATVTRPFTDLRRDLETALKKMGVWLEKTS